MSRSYQKSPVIAPNSNKAFKRQANRRLRHQTRALLYREGNAESLVFKIAREVSNIYDSAKDGKCNMFGGQLDEYTIKAMRK
jgi:hypothetical protein